MNPPDRLSVDKQSPHYIPYWITRVLVFIDGELSDGCVEYCISEGWALVYRRNEDDTLVVENERAVIDRIEGEIKVTEKKN